MHDGGDETADGGGLFGLDELGLRRPKLVERVFERLLRLLLFGDVPGDTDQPGHVPVGVLETRSVRRVPPPAAIGVTDAVFDTALFLAGVDDSVEKLVASREVIGMDERRERAPDDLRDLLAENVGPVRRRVAEYPLGG